MATLTTRIYGRKVTQGQDIYGIPFVSVETADHSGYETKRFPQGQWVADEYFVKAQFNIVEEMFGWSLSSEMRIDPFYTGDPVEDEDIVVVSDCVSCSTPHNECIDTPCCDLCAMTDMHSHTEQGHRDYRQL